MNAVEIEEAVSELVAEPFDPAEFAFQFIIAFGAKKTTVDRLRKGDSNQSDVGGVLQRNNIHIATAPAGGVRETFAALRASPKTASNRVKFVLATDGDTVEAEDLIGGDVIACAYPDLPRHFATFLPLAGISTVKEIKNNPIDVKATGRLNKLYVELLKDNPDWATEERRHELNQFMARLIFCFFAEDTGIFREGQFTATIAQMSHAGHGAGDEQWGNAHEVLTELFRAMDTPVTHEGNLDDRYRRAAGIRPYADVFPYVNGGLFTGATESPRFSRTARAYLLRAGELDWKEINPDIFGSMIQAVADDGERGELGMHYTSVPNILKVLNPLFLDDLREQLEAAGDSKQKLRNLRKRLGNIRVFDPACGSGNFLVIAYKEMRAIEAEIVAKLGGEDNLKLANRRSVIPLSNFYGIEIKGFAAEIARLALLIAEFQADCVYLSQQEARAMVLPLHKTGQITVGNALRLDWLEVCAPSRLAVEIEQDLGGPTGRLALEESDVDGITAAETYICGNPPYVGDKFQSDAQKADLAFVATGMKNAKAVDYIAGWFWKASRYIRHGGTFAFVSTNSVCQGVQVPIIWPPIFKAGQTIAFAYQGFYWSNSASKNANVICVIVGISSKISHQKLLFSEDQVKLAANINAYLIDGPAVVVEKHPEPISDLPIMFAGNIPRDQGNFMLSSEQRLELLSDFPAAAAIVRRIQGSFEFINGIERFCLWISDRQAAFARSIPSIQERLDRISDYRATGSERGKLGLQTPYKFERTITAAKTQLIVPRVSSERRPYLPVGILPPDVIISDAAQAIYDSPIYILSIIASRMHAAWVGVTAGRMKSDYRYSSGVCYNSFPLPKLTKQDRIDLTRTAENILLAREAHFPATVADLYDLEAMPEDLRRAHDENDEVLERIYIGRRFRNDTERLEKLFDLYTKMTANAAPKGKPTKKGKQAA
jgi:hypothetical protein